MSIIISVLLNALALIITAYIVPGFGISDFKTAILAAVLLGLVNAFIRPFLLFLTAPLNILTLGLFTFVVNAIMLELVAALVSGVMIENWLAAIIASIVLSLTSTALSMLLRDLGTRRKKK